jgi:uncharacterized protein with PhoU and TrkA domain
MLRNDKSNLRIEELPVPDTMVGRPLSDLNLKEFRHLLLLAVRNEDGWLHNPSREHVMARAEILVFMTTPTERQNLEKIFASI